MYSGPAGAAGSFVVDRPSETDRRGMDLSTRCEACGGVAAVVELSPPNELPAEFAAWPEDRQASYRQYQDLSGWRLIYNGPGGGNGGGDSIDPVRAAAFQRVLAPPIQLDALDDLDLYDDAGICRECGVAYCPTHWDISVGGYGHCPQGHGKSLDSHWSPSSYD